jgi:import inner membrane translocase subunit TIM54
VTVFLAAPPGDGIRPAREYFQEYVKPILVAAAYDWEVIEGRREGDVRAGLAKRIREQRRKSGELSLLSAGEAEADDDLKMIQEKGNIQPPDGLGGDLIIGRHTWKEYMRGLHEGWLGSLDPPPEPVPTSSPPSVSFDLATQHSVDDQAVENPPELDRASAVEPPKAAADAPKNPTLPTPSYITPAHYSSASLASTAPSSFAPAMPLPFPHILGFLNTPIRMKRYLSQRYQADEIGRLVATAILAESSRPWAVSSASASGVDHDSAVGAGGGGVVEASQPWEQEAMLKAEEKEWHKSAREPSPAGQEDQERVWKEDMAIDRRIGEKMGVFLLTREERDNAQRRAGVEAEQKKATAAAEPGWVETAKEWTGWAGEKRGKSWQDGLVGDEAD